MKKFAGCLISLLLIIGMMSGCGAVTADSTTKTDTTTAIIDESQQSTSQDETVFDNGDTTAVTDTTENKTEADSKEEFYTQVKDDIATIDSIPKFDGEPYVIINGNNPYFKDSDNSKRAFENYSGLDSLGRCGVAYANVCKDTMPTKERGAIGQIKPSGWHTVKYDWVDGKYLYNRCHLIGYQLTAENANEKNLITGTRYLNVNGMLPFENMVADYVKATDNHVLYRVTPVFKGDNLVASGVLMEAKSVEDRGEGICFNVYCYNNQPGVKITYSTGESKATKDSSNITTQKTTTVKSEKTTSKGKSSSKSSTYILNTNSKKFHKSSCSSVKKMSPSNKETYKGTRESLIDKGYSPCKICNP